MLLSSRCGLVSTPQLDPAPAALYSRSVQTNALFLRPDPHFYLPSALRTPPLHLHFVLPPEAQCLFAHTLFAFIPPPLPLLLLHFVSLRRWPNVFRAHLPLFFGGSACALVVLPSHARSRTAVRRLCTLLYPCARCSREEWAVEGQRRRTNRWMICVARRKSSSDLCVSAALPPTATDVCH